MGTKVMWIYEALLCVVIAVNTESYKERALTLQRYEKTEGYRLVCTACPLLPLARSSRSLERCARRCSKVKKSFLCRAFNFEPHNKKCHLLPYDSLSPGAQAEPHLNFSLYQNKDYVRECIVGSGESYRGRRSWTRTNVTCQPWNDSIPHDHKFEPKKKHFKSDLRENYCRNPENDQGGPWCFTTDPNIRHQDCGLPQCSEQVCMRCNGEDYRGKMDHTESGKECQRWDLSKPHRHLHQPKKYPGKGLRDNYCRNPDNRPRPWCYTMDPAIQWEYCNITACGFSEENAVNATSSCVRGKGTDYRGLINTTPAGVTCQRWDSQFPHSHSYTPQNYNCKDLKENYCRNPDESDYPWCFTTDPNQRIAFCTHISRCDADSTQTSECYEDSGENYRGTLSRTRSGIPCGPWNHTYSGDRHSTLSSKGLEGNYCRNPDRDKHGPWCYTRQNEPLSWDYCKLKRCENSSSFSQVAPQQNSLSKPSCFVHKTTRIVGGAQVHTGDGSWVVSIQKQNVHWCGGSLIREDWVLTDQKCFSSCFPELKDYSVQVGLRHLNDSFLHPRLHIAHVVCGPEGSNLALLKLVKPAPLSEKAYTIQLPVKECSVAEDTNCTMYGWGETKGTGHEGALKSVTLPMVNNDMCAKLKAGRGESRLCAGGKRNKGVCERDYGGPLVCQEEERKVIIGVSVHGPACAAARRPALFVNVAFYSEWIYKVFRLYPVPPTPDGTVPPPGR
ncbi:hepatocyte growth factor a [Aplochiton taeniatus]